MKILLLNLLSLLFLNCTYGQAYFTPVDFTLKKTTNQKSTEILYSDSSSSFKFQLAQQSVELKENFLVVDSLLIQISPLKVNDYKKNIHALDTTGQREFLDAYSKYEMDYFSNELKIEVISPKNQWVVSNSRYWLIWYFKVGSLQTSVKRNVEFQLFASTIVGDKIFTLNAPIMQGDNVGNAALIVDQLMRTMTATR